MLDRALRAAAGSTARVRSAFATPDHSAAASKTQAPNKEPMLHTATLLRCWQRPAAPSLNRSLTLSQHHRAQPKGRES